MTVLSSNLGPRAENFQENAGRMRALVGDLREQAERIRLGGSEQARNKHLARGKLLPRDRVRALLDTGSPFLEIGQFAACGMYGGDVPGAGVIAGIGRVSGVEVDAPAFRGTRMSNCLREGALRWRFPTFKKGPLNYTYPFLFR